MCDTKTHSLTHPLNCFFLAKGRQRILFSFFFSGSCVYLFFIIIKGRQRILTLLDFQELLFLFKDTISEPEIDGNPTLFLCLPMEMKVY